MVEVAERSIHIHSTFGEIKVLSIDLSPRGFSAFFADLPSIIAIVRAIAIPDGPFITPSGCVPTDFIESPVDFDRVFALDEPAV